MMKQFLSLVLFIMIGGFLSSQEGGTAVAEGASSAPEKSEEEKRYDTIRYGTDTEIAALIQTIKTEQVTYLDDELAKLAGQTKNRNILSGIFTFFGDRQKEGLEERALRAIEERDDEANETILAAIEYLGKVAAGDAAGPLEKLLDNEERRFMNAAFRALGRVVTQENAGEVAEYLLGYYEGRDPGDENRREIIVALGETKAKEGVSFLASLAVNDDERIPLRLAALSSLAKIGDPQGLEAVLSAASSQDPNVRSAAIAALGPFSGDAVDSAILEAFRDSYYRTRIAAAQAAKERKLADAVPYLRYRSERDEVPAVKDEAIRALGAIDNNETTAALESLFSERKNTDRVRILAAEMLLQNDPGRFAEKVIADLDEAKTKNQTALYNGFLRVLGAAKTGKLEGLVRRFFSSGGVIEKSYALDMTVNNEFRGLADQVRELADPKNGSLSRKARETLRKLGL
ncbi:PBS lyase [Spirochaetia bacterium]|nr:PBS lyase [Spirochaetia bacterium]